MPELGSSLLIVALFFSCYAAIISFIQGRKQHPAWIVSSENAIFTVFGLLTGAMALLIAAFVTNDFHLRYVTQNSSLTQPLFYRISALWGGNEGSLLLWGWLLGLFGTIVLIQNRHKNRELIPYATGVMMLTTTFFLILLNFFTNPFQTLATPPADGHGLNPLLQNPGMVFHPPTLYLGYVGFTIPFAFAIAALISGKLGSTWITSTRRWTLFSWLMLTLGILFGAQWAYEVLGWGGYWAWDPVENASIMPWLVGTAYLHSVMIQEKRNMLKVWNIILILATFGLSIFGTFLTRSGIISSVHAFGQSELGYWFLGFLGLIFISGVLLLSYRLPELRSENRLDSLLSRESSFMFNNVLLVGMTFAVLWGTIFPIISEAVRGTKISVGAPFFNQVTVPIGLALLLLTGLCPLLAWRKASQANLRRHFLIPTIITLVGTATLVVLGIHKIYALMAWTLSLFVLSTIGSEFWRGTKARRRQTGYGYPRSFVQLIRRNQRRYGGYIIHIGVVLSFVAFAGAAFNKETLLVLKEGESASIQDYTLRYGGLTQIPQEGRYVVRATIDVQSGGRQIDTLTPEKRFFPDQEQPATKAVIRSTLKEDLYVILAGYDTNAGTATFKFMVKPLVGWLWTGMYVIIGGAIIVLMPPRSRRRVAVQAREPVTSPVPHISQPIATTHALEGMLEK